MRYKIYTRTDKAWDAMLYAISHAKSSILFEMYIFVDDTSDTHDFIEILREKALSGLKVKVIFDAFGSSVSSESVKKLRDAGVELFFYRTLFRVTHRKILVVDERTAFVGGINIKKFFKKWTDLSMKVEGRIVESILKSYAGMYRDCGGRDEFVLKYEKKMNVHKGRIWFLEHHPLKNSFQLKKYYSGRIDLARTNIFIATPYFMPNRWVVKALKRASKRGVKIEIILPLMATHPKAANISNYHFMHKLYKHGVKFFLTKDMNHSKIMLVDGEEGILGSQNVDILSFDFNMESGVFFTDPDLIRELNQVVEDWKKDSIPYSPILRDSHLPDYFLGFCFDFFEHVVFFFNKFTQALKIRIRF